MLLNNPPQPVIKHTLQAMMGRFFIHNPIGQRLIGFGKGLKSRLHIGIHKGSIVFYEIVECAIEDRFLLDSDVQAALQPLAETYQTLANGIVYEKPPHHRLQRVLYDRLRRVIEEHQKKADGRLIAGPHTRDSEMRDLLILLTQLAAGWANGRPKGRAFMDMLRSQFKPGTFAFKAGSSLIVTP